jgi:hypothetical protein
MLTFDPHIQLDDVGSEERGEEIDIPAATCSIFAFRRRSAEPISFFRFHLDNCDEHWS